MSNMGYRENMVSYLEALEIEKHKIQMFQRELPLCLELVNQAIEGCRKQLYGTSMDHVNERSNRSEDGTSTKDTRKPVLEEFIPLKSCDDDDDDDVEYSREQPKDNNKDKMKSDWLRSAQLWNPSSELLFKEDSPSREIVMEVKGNKKDGGIINEPLNKEDISSGKSKEALMLGNKLDRASSSPSPASSTAETTVTTKGISGGNSNSNNNKKEDKQLSRQSPTTIQSRRKQRRCWSHDLHRSFVEALQQLGGPDVATPKQIRELMKVDGLTNDEVKSHLQKYRLHAKRPSSANHDNMVATPPAPPPPPQQFVVVGGIWVPPPPPPEFPAVSAAPTLSTATELYGAPAAPQANIPQPSSPFIQKKQRQSHLTSEDRCSHGKRRVLSNSTASSSSVYASAVC